MVFYEEFSPASIFADNLLIIKGLNAVQTEILPSPFTSRPLLTSTMTAKKLNCNKLSLSFGFQ